MSDLFASPELDGNRTGRVASINCSNGGVPKKAITVARVSLSAIEGDAQHNLKYHGGPDRAVSLYSLERIEALRAEGHPVAAGTTGENITVIGLDWNLVVPGVKVRIGAEVVLEITSFTKPCKTIRESFVDGHFVRISQKLHPGWSRVYARVLAEGQIKSGDVVEVISADGKHPNQGGPNNGPTFEQ
jgi:MOSC domain-containing protein YiiM